MININSEGGKKVEREGIIFQHLFQPPLYLETLVNLIESTYDMKFQQNPEPTLKAIDTLFK